MFALAWPLAVPPILTRAGWTLATVVVLSIAAVYFMTVTGTQAVKFRHTEILSAQEATALEGASVPMLPWDSVCSSPAPSGCGLFAKHFISSG